MSERDKERCREREREPALERGAERVCSPRSWREIWGEEYKKMNPIDCPFLAEVMTSDSKKNKPDGVFPSLSPPHHSPLAPRFHSTVLAVASSP